jgi:hypothetical protein
VVHPSEDPAGLGGRWLPGGFAGWLTGLVQRAQDGGAAEGLQGAGDRQVRSSSWGSSAVPTGIGAVLAAFVLPLVLPCIFLSALCAL